MSSSMSRSATTAGNNHVKEKPPHPVEYRYKAQVIDSYPRIGKEGQARAKSGWEAPNAPPPTTTHSFVLTKEDGTKLHCTSLTFWEKPIGQLGATLKYQSRAWYVRNINESDLEYLTHLKSQIHALKSQLARDDLLDPDERLVVEDRLKLFTDLMKPYVTNACVDTDALWVPRALVLMSPWPVYDLMEDWLKCTYRGIMDANGTTLALEACLVNVVHEVPMPPPGRREVSFYPLFRSLTVESIVFLFECLLNEKRILLVSEFPGLLNTAIQSLLLLMFPFNWFHVLISVLPIDLIGYLEAPVPFLIGMLATHLPLIQPEILSDDLVLVNLDTGAVTSTLRASPVALPPRRRGKFVARLKGSCQLDPGIGAGPPLATTEAFPLGKLQTRTGTSLLATPMAMRDRIGASDPDLLAHMSSSGSASLRSPDSVSSSEISMPPAVQIYPAGQGPGSSRATPSVISVATTTSLASRFSLFRRGSNASAAVSSVGSGSTVLAPAPGAGGAHQNSGFLAPATAHKVVIEGHAFSTDASMLSLAAHHHPTPTGHPPASNPRRWSNAHSLSSTTSRCIECDAHDSPAKPVLRCTHCALAIHLDCARTSLVAWCPRALDEPRIRRAALKLWVSIMRGYRTYLTPGVGVGINVVRWVNEGTDADARAFMKMMVDTQAFGMFVQDRTGGVEGASSAGGAADAEIIFFDEAIKAKRGRLARTVVRSGSDNAFFKDLSFAVTSVYRCPSPHQGDRVQVHRSFPFTTDAAFANTPIRKCDSLITPQEELMLTLYTAKMIRQAKRYAQSAAAAAAASTPATPVAGMAGVGRPNTSSTSSTSNSPTTPMGEWWRRINAVTSATSAMPSPASADIVDQFHHHQHHGGEASNGTNATTGIASSGGLLDMLVPRPGYGVGIETPDQSRQRVDDFLNRAWDTLKDPVFGQPLRSRDDYALRHAKLSEISHGLNTLLLTCQQADLDDIILITSQIDRMVAGLEDEFRDLFVDEGMLNRLLGVGGEAAPKVEWTSPSVDLSDLDVLRMSVVDASAGVRGPGV
ncbi:AEX-3 domain-domain-containing protein [Catenaria anguillulae PL171]|uniref:AEX-3 domain-domain-containing protein n=1 Tax=Catenaria anguillulae PL171 TaxID=765915 RepID=A0A1Y2HKT8_9FUNG|nr:AEX-3 domain-domain-containing protein [Catenaria anguillulae PL171]